MSGRVKIICSEQIKDHSNVSEPDNSNWTIMLQIITDKLTVAMLSELFWAICDASPRISYAGST